MINPVLLLSGDNPVGVEPTGSPNVSSSGSDGSRTRVQKSIPCPSTIVVNYFGILHPCSLNDTEVYARIISVAS